MKRIFLAAHYNLNNGDRAVLEATISQLSEQKNSDIIVSAYSPEKLNDNRFKTVGWPLKNFFSKKVFNLIIKFHKIFLLKYFYRILIDKEYLSALEGSDIVLISGGHHLTDILGEYTFYQLAINFLVPIYCNKKIYLLPQSIGPIKEDNKYINKDLVFILNHVEHIAYRDRVSKDLIDKKGIMTKNDCIPDIVYALKNKKFENERKTIGIALYCNYTLEKKDLMNFVLDNLVKTIEWLLSKNYKVKIIPMEVKNSTNDDRVVANKLINRLKETENIDNFSIEEPKDNNIESIVELFSNKDMVLAYKTHSVIFSLINTVPVIAIAYHPKSIEFMDSIGLKKYAIEDKKADFDTLKDMIINVNNNSSIIKEKEINGVKERVHMINSYLNDIIFNGLQ